MRVQQETRDRLDAVEQYLSSALATGAQQQVSECRAEYDRLRDLLAAASLRLRAAEDELAKVGHYKAEAERLRAQSRLASSYHQGG